MPLALPNFANLMDFVFGNAVYLVIGGVLLFFALKYFQVSRKSQKVVIDRRKIELANFVDSMKYNFSTSFVWLYKGDRRIGKIINYAEFLSPKKVVISKSKSSGKLKFLKQQDPRSLKMDQTVLVASIVFKPSYNRFPICKPFAKPDAIYIKLSKDSVVMDEKKKKIVLNEKTAINRYMGIRFDMGDSVGMHKNILFHNLIKTDMEQAMSRLWVQTQLQCVFSPEVATSAMLREKELQVELARRKGKAESI